MRGLLTCCALLTFGTRAAVTIGRNDALDSEMTLAQSLEALDLKLSDYVPDKVSGKPIQLSISAPTPLGKPQPKAKSRKSVGALKEALAVGDELHEEFQTAKKEDALEKLDSEALDDPLGSVDKLVAKAEADNAPSSPTPKPAAPLPKPESMPPAVPQEVPARQRLRANTKALIAPTSPPKPIVVAPFPIPVPAAAEPEEKVPEEKVEKLESEALEDALPSSSTSQASEMEKSLTEMMMAGGNLGATPFGKSVGQIKDLILKDMMPKVLKAHQENQEQLYKFSAELHSCEATKKEQVAKSDLSKKRYLYVSPIHKTCREGESADHMAKIDCLNEERDKKDVMELKCKAFLMTKKRYGDQKGNSEIVKKGGSEQDESYVRRLTATICGKPYVSGKPGHGGAGVDGFLDVYMIAKTKCEKATSEYRAHVKKCKHLSQEYKLKRTQCDRMQDLMDTSSCKRAIGMKDACETYAECYFDRRRTFESTEKMVKIEESDRKVEWRGLKRMECLMAAFSDGKVKNSEITTCRNQTHSLTHLNVIYPEVPALASCQVPDLYPSTPAYKLREFAGLPALAKGREDANPCTGVVPIPIIPRKGSPKTCKCERTTLNGPYSAGPLVTCKKCWQVRRATDMNSCPDGTKIFSPSSSEDWKTIFASVGELPAPYWIVDVTRSRNGNGGSNDTAMNSRGGTSENPMTFKTSDGSPWWLRDKPSEFDQPNANYQSSCYPALTKPYGNADNMHFKYDECKFHASSYYCQLIQHDHKPKRGSPAACKCENVVLTGPYSAGALLKCTGCLPVARSTQKNSCPLGTKIFSPAGSQDWKTFLASAQPLRSPHWIIDVTRPQNGCGGCSNHAMNSKNAAQMTWRTSDGSPWWLRSSKYNEPAPNYLANCYMDLFQPPPNENAILFRTKKCKYFSNAYYCQPVKAQPKSDDGDGPADPDASGDDPADGPGDAADAPRFVPGDALLQSDMLPRLDAPEPEMMPSPVYPYPENSTNTTNSTF